MKSDSRQYHFGPFTFSVARGLHRGEEPIPLPPRVQALLLHLLDARGDFVRKDVLREAIGDGTPASDASLWRSVYLLRTALQDTNEQIIRTGYGKGVRIIADFPEDPSPPQVSGIVETQQHWGMSGLSAHFAQHAATGEQMIRTAFELASTRTDRQFQLAGAVLKEALKRFPNLALAPSVHADVETSRMFRGYAPAGVLAHNARQLLAKALSIQPGLPSALATQGLLLGVIDDDIPAGLELIDASLLAAPRAWLSGFYKAWLLIGQRRLADALATLDSALMASPLERGLLGLKGYVLWVSGNVDGCDAFVTENLRLRPDIDLLWILDAVVALNRKQHAKANSSMAFAVALHPDDTYVLANHTWLLAATGHQTEALEFLVKASKRRSGYMSPVHIAMIRAALDDKVSARNMLKIADADRDPWRLLAWCDPRLTTLGRP